MFASMKHCGASRHSATGHETRRAAIRAIAIASPLHKPRGAHDDDVDAFTQLVARCLEDADKDTYCRGCVW